MFAYPVILYRAFALFIARDALYFSAAFAFYAPLALIPLLFITLTTLSFFYGDTQAGIVISSIGANLGDELTTLIKEAVNRFTVRSADIVTSVTGGFFLITFCIVTINTLGDGFLRLWGVAAYGLMNWLSKLLRAIVFLILAQVYFVFLIGFELYIVPIVFSDNRFLDFLVLFGATLTLFTLMYRFLTLEAPRFMSCVVGACVSSLLFVGIKSLVDVYVANTPLLSVYAGAGIILLLFAWVYVFAALTLYGAAVAGIHDSMKK